MLGDGNGAIPHLFLESEAGEARVVNGQTTSGPNPGRTRKYKPETGPNRKTNLNQILPKNFFEEFFWCQRL